jgi:hypothetical protein
VVLLSVSNVLSFPHVYPAAAYVFFLVLQTLFISLSDGHSVCREELKIITREARGSFLCLSDPEQEAVKGFAENYNGISSSIKDGEFHPPLNYFCSIQRTKWVPLMCR